MKAALVTNQQLHLYFLLLASAKVRHEDCKAFDSPFTSAAPGRMWFVVTEEWNLELQAVIREQLHWAKLPKGYFPFFFFFFISQDRRVAASDLSGFFPVTGNPQALPLHKGSSLTVKYFQQTALWMAVSTQNSIFHLNKHVIGSQNGCRCYCTLPFSTYFHFLNSKNQYWSDTDSLHYHKLFAFSNYKLLFKTQEFMCHWNSRGKNWNQANHWDMLQKKVDP